MIADEARLLLALKLFDSHRVSMGKAAEMAGYSKPKFKELAGKHGVPVFDLDEGDLGRELADNVSSEEPIRTFYFKALLTYVVGGDYDDVCERYIITTYRRAQGRTPEEAVTALIESIADQSPAYENSDGEVVQIQYVGVLDAIDASTLDEDEVWCDVSSKCGSLDDLRAGLPGESSVLDKIR